MSLAFYFESVCEHSPLDHVAFTARQNREAEIFLRYHLPVKSKFSTAFLNFFYK